YPPFIAFISFFSILTTLLFLSFFFTATPTTEIYTLSLHDALPIFRGGRGTSRAHRSSPSTRRGDHPRRPRVGALSGRSRSRRRRDRKSTRLNSSHVKISYAVFCLKKKKKKKKKKKQRENTKHRKPR